MNDEQRGPFLLKWLMGEDALVGQAVVLDSKTRKLILWESPRVIYVMVDTVKEGDWVEPHPYVYQGDYYLRKVRDK